jgi:hypothetical protein
MPERESLDRCSLPGYSESFLHRPQQVRVKLKLLKPPRRGGMCVCRSFRGCIGGWREGLR